MLTYKCFSWLLLLVVGVPARRIFPLPREHVITKARSNNIEPRQGPDWQNVRTGQASRSQFLNCKSSKFVVNGSAIPDVDFDVGESYAGQLPVGLNSDDQKLFWWFFPSTNPNATKEIVIWLNGGPGCSSLEGFLQENGPFLWQYGTYKPVANPWAWNRLTNMVWVEQPVGTGFSTGTVTATSERDVAAQFLSFWKNFVDTFRLQGYKVYITGESYAGFYCPYIASAMLDANDTTYYNMKGMMFYDGVVAADDIQMSIPLLDFIDYWHGLMPLKNSTMSELRDLHNQCHYTDYYKTYLTFPPAGPQPATLPGHGLTPGPLTNGCNDLWTLAYEYMLQINPCFNIYQVSTTCPLQWDVLGFPGSSEYLPKGASIYFDRADVKKAINAPSNVTWTECSEAPVFAGNGGDKSPPSGQSVLPGVIERTQNVIIANGILDMIIIANGTLLGIQNMTWGGQLGFQSRPRDPFFVPYHNDTSLSTVAGSGVMGVTHTERGLTWVTIDLAGHMVPQYAPSAAYRQLEKLLGRVSSLSSTQPFTTDPDVPQPANPLDDVPVPPPSAMRNGQGILDDGAFLAY